MILGKSEESQGITGLVFDSQQQGKRDLSINITTSQFPPSKFFSVSHCPHVSKPNFISL